ncbi:MAG: ferredoxin [Actinomycetota bacterium]|nr:ferredoxin [Actinomycetota bacterium]
MTRVVVADPDLCQGHAMCALEDASLFEVPKHGTVQIARPEVTPDNEAAVLAAIRHCPTQALSLKES